LAVSSHSTSGGQLSHDPDPERKLRACLSSLRFRQLHACLVSWRIPLQPACFSSQFIPKLRARLFS
jgi:hypothetical protein